MTVVTTFVPGRWAFHPHLAVVLRTVPAFGPWDDRAATSRSAKAARRQLELRYPAARGDCPYAPKTAASQRGHPLANAEQRKRPTCIVCAGGASKLSRLEGATYYSGLSVRSPAVMVTARASRAVTHRLLLDGLVASTDARQLVDAWARPGCRMRWSRIETKDVVM